MSVITVERPAPAAEPKPSRFTRWWNVGLRLALLAILAVAAVVALPSARPHTRSPSEFLDDLQSGQVTAVRYVSGQNEVRWSEGWLQWYQAGLDAPLPPLPAPANGVTVDAEGSTEGTGHDWVSKAVFGLAGRRLSYDTIDTSGANGRLSWVDQLPWQGLSAASGGAALAAFVLMLFRREHRYGNRWAWFWVMAATSGLGSVLYLALEPAPLWQKPSRQRPLPARPIFLGGAGVLIAIALKPALALLALLVSAS